MQLTAPGNRSGAVRRILHHQPHAGVGDRHLCLGNQNICLPAALPQVRIYHYYHVRVPSFHVYNPPGARSPQQMCSQIKESLLVLLWERRGWLSPLTLDVSLTESLPLRHADQWQGEILQFSETWNLLFPFR